MENRDRISITSAVTPNGELYFMIGDGSTDSNRQIKEGFS